VNFLKQICQAFGRLPQAIANFVRQRQRQNELVELEAERLDRIRHPEKYRGK
jgi:hypothetical protein